MFVKIFFTVYTKISTNYRSKSKSIKFTLILIL